MHAGPAPSVLLVHAAEGVGVHTGTHWLSLQCLLPREVAQRNSPILCVPQAVPVAASCEVLVAVAQHDSPEFRRQSQEYSQVSYAGMLCGLLYLDLLCSLCKPLSEAGSGLEISELVMQSCKEESGAGCTAESGLPPALGRCLFLPLGPALSSSQL